MAVIGNSGSIRNTGDPMLLQQQITQLEKEKRELFDGVVRLLNSALKGEPLCETEKTPELEASRTLLEKLMAAKANSLTNVASSAPLVTPPPGELKAWQKALEERAKKAEENLRETKKEIFNLRSERDALHLKIAEINAKVLATENTGIKT